MPNNLDYLTLLQSAIEQTHKCMAVHSQTVRVHEKLDGQTIWNGEVEVFDLDGHAEAKKCYAWSHEEAESNTRFVTVLHKRPVNSPEMAVRSAIFFDREPAPYAHPNLHST